MMMRSNAKENGNKGGTDVKEDSKSIHQDPPAVR